MACLNNPQKLAYRATAGFAAPFSQDEGPNSKPLSLHLCASLPSFPGELGAGWEAFDPESASWPMFDARGFGFRVWGLGLGGGGYGCLCL